ncbi:MAG: COX15/CtaA family protein [Chloroflexi bacterium]|nr:COX15/CtaA family protein [Chloroflexota bacterium]
MRLSRFAIYAWGIVVYNVAVILWGAYVRASGSGAGCGSHWPVCNGEIVPRAAPIETVIEFSHRLTSGLALVGVLALIMWAFRAFPGGSHVRRAAVFSGGIMLLEALLGAGLVLFGLTAKNDSVARAIVMAIHLVNTFLLLGGLTLTAWWASGGRPMQLRGQGGLALALAGGVLAAIALGATGAVTALGDTLFPAGSLAEGIQQDLSPTAHFLVQLRVIHPVLAVLVGAYAVAIGVVSSILRRGDPTRRLALLLGGVYLAQLAVGVVNLSLLAPMSLQIVHLLLADLLWITLVLTAATALAAPMAAADTGERVPEAAWQRDSGLGRPV